MSAYDSGKRPSNMGQDQSALAQQSINISAGRPRIISRDVCNELFLTSCSYGTTNHYDEIKFGKRSDRLKTGVALLALAHNLSRWLKATNMTDYSDIKHTTELLESKFMCID